MYYTISKMINNMRKDYEEIPTEEINCNRNSFSNNIKTNQHSNGIISSITSSVCSCWYSIRTSVDSVVKSGNYRFLIVLLLVLWIVIVIVHSVFFTHPKVCAGPPYIYATFHNKVKNIVKYSTNGCLLEANVLTGGPMHKGNTELRTMAFGHYNNQKVLFVANATSHASSLQVFSDCDNNGTREFVTTVVTTEMNPGADHTYGICFDDDENIYASFQHTDTVLRFYKDTFEPMPLPPALSYSNRDSRYEKYHNKQEDYFKGTFFQFGKSGQHEKSEQGIRSIIKVKNNIWISNEDLEAVLLVSIETGEIVNTVDIIGPIGMHYDHSRALVYVGSKAKHSAGAVYAVDIDTLEIKKKFKTRKMAHPAGVTSHGNILYVAELKRGEILSFDIDEGRFLETVVTNTKVGRVTGTIEQIVMSYC